MTWGILAYLAATPRARRYLSAMSAVVSLGVGLTTVYLGTHWLSDVVLGWAAGLLILLGLPWVEPLITRAENWIFAARERLSAHSRLVPSPPVAAGGPRPVPAGPPAVGDAAAQNPVREPVAAGGRQAAVITAAGRPRAHPAPPAHQSHAVRSERTPVTPAGSRRPPHADRTPRGGTAPARPVTGG